MLCVIFHSEIKMAIKKALSDLYRRVNALRPTKDGSDNDNVKYLKSLFEGKTDKEITELAKTIKEKGMIIPYIAPNFDDKNECKMEDIIAVGKELGYETHQNVWITEEDGISYQMPIKHLVGMLYVRRQNQTAMHSAGYADIGNTINTLTGQVTGNSKVTRISFPELTLIAQYPHMEPVMQEFMQFRGGDVKARRYLKWSIANTGYADHKMIDSMGSSARIVSTLNMFLIGASLNSTIEKKEQGKI